MQSAKPPDALLAESKPFRATFYARAASDEEPVSVGLLLLPATTGRLLSGRPFPPASTADIEAFETRFDVRLRPDYRHFLETVNGADLGWYTGFTWREDPETFYELFCLAEEVRAFVGATWGKPSYIYGIGNRHPQIDVATFGPELHFYRAELMRHAYLVGVDGGGNNFVQVAQGRHAGRVLKLDHEVYYGGLSTLVDLDEMDEDERARLPWTDFADASTDSVIDKSEEYGFMMPAADDFATFYAREVDAALIFNEIKASHYRKD